MNKHRIWTSLIIVTFVLLSCRIVYVKLTNVTGDMIIDEFNRNFKHFDNIEAYAIDTSGKLYINNYSDEIIISDEEIKETINSESYKTIDIENLYISSDIKLLFNNLNYKGIYEKDVSEYGMVIEFVRTNDELEQGIVYFCGSVNELYAMEMEHIVGNWYYYCNGYV